MNNYITKKQATNITPQMIITCLLISAAVCISQIVGSTSLLLLCLFIYICFNIWACDKGESFPVLLFFLPWSPLLKLYNGGISFYTIALLITCLVSFLRNRISVKLYQVILTATLMGLTLIAKAIQGNSIGKDYLLFLVMLALFPCVAKECRERVSFLTCTLFFAAGIISAALIAQQIVVFPNISQYITVDSYLTITRLSGFYGDPNFYSAHVTACLAGIQLLLCFENSRTLKIVLAILSIVLLYCGLLSASKSFIIVLACLFLFWIPLLLKNGSLSNRVQIFLGILVAAFIILTSSAFQSLFEIIDTRFAEDSTMSEFTTGRTELWRNYISELLHNIPLLLFGEGYTAVNLNRKGSHNSIIQLVYQFGLIGAPVLIAWLSCTLRNATRVMKLDNVDWKFIALMCVGVGLPWMGIDILLFDEFFLLPIYVISGITHVAIQNDVSSN